MTASAAARRPNAAGAAPRADFTPEEAEKLFAARLLAAEARPYLATALFALRPIVSWRVPTMAVDRFWRCYVFPGFLASTPVDELAAVWVHEVSHLLRDHHGRGERLAARHDRAGPGERLRTNIAADFEINDDAYGDGLPRPAGAILPQMLNLPAGELLEDYVPKIPLGPYARELAWLECGSGADGLDRPWELGPAGAYGLDEQERALVRYRVAQAITGAPGTVAGGWQRWAERVIHPPQPWRELLGAAIRSAVSAGGAGDDYVYSRPSRRSASLPGVVLPSLRRRPLRVSVLIDTSGSVSDAELGGALLEVAAVVRVVGRRDLVRVLSCDTDTHVAAPICAAEGITLIGGGGTDLREGFRRALSGGPVPDALVVLTDGQTPWPERRPPCRTVIGLFPRPRRPRRDEDDYEPDLPPAWARVVTIG